MMRINSVYANNSDPFELRMILKIDSMALFVAPFATFLTSTLVALFTFVGVLAFLVLLAVVTCNLKIHKNVNTVL